jgi:hypothetical protein
MSRGPPVRSSFFPVPTGGADWTEEVSGELGGLGGGNAKAGIRT